MKGNPMTESTRTGDVAADVDIPSWTPPDVDIDSVTTGDMPGDKVQINQSHIDKANTIFPHLLGDSYAKADEQMARFMEEVVPLVD